MKKILLSLLICLTFIANAAAGLPFAEKVLVKKAERKLYLLNGGKAFKEYNIALGDAPKGHKQQEGDERTPEGLYTIDCRNPKSAYHLSLHINYPNKEDKKRATKKGVSPGGDIFIHGSPNGFDMLASSFLKTDWTDGCIAVSSNEIEEIWRLVKNGTPIEILP